MCKPVGPAYLPAKGDGPQQRVCCMQDACLQWLGQAGVGPIPLTTDCSSSCTTLCRRPGSEQSCGMGCMQPSSGNLRMGATRPAKPSGRCSSSSGAGTSGQAESTSVDTWGTASSSTAPGGRHHQAHAQWGYIVSVDIKARAADMAFLHLALMLHSGSIEQSAMQPGKLPGS